MIKTFQKKPVERKNSQKKFIKKDNNLNNKNENREYKINYNKKENKEFKIIEYDRKDINIKKDEYDD